MKKTLRNKISIINLIIGLIILSSTIFFSICDSTTDFFPIINDRGEIYTNELYSLFGSAYTLTYYTFQTNYMVAIVFILSFFGLRTKSFDTFFLMAVSYIVFTFVIYWTAIVPFSETYKWSLPYWVINNFWLHFVNPTLSFIVLFLNRKKLNIYKKYIKWFSLYPSIFIAYAALVFYLGGSIVLDPTTNKYVFVGLDIYSFLNLDSPIFINLSNNRLAALYIYMALMCVVPFVMSLVSLLFIYSYKLNIDKKFWWYEHKEKSILMI